MRSVVILLIALTIPFAAGCGGGEEEGTEGAASSGGETVKITGTDFKFDPADVTVDKAGTVTFEFVNDGKSQHALEIEGQGLEEETDTIGPGETAKLTVDLKEGDYEIYCPVDGHKDLGMKGTVTVGAGGGGSGTSDTDTESGGGGGY